MNKEYTVREYLTREEYEIFLTKYKDFKRYLKKVIVPELARIEGVYIDDSRDYDIDWCFHEGCLEITLNYTSCDFHHCNSYEYELFFKVRCEDLLREDWEEFLTKIQLEKNQAAIKAKEEADRLNKEKIEKTERAELARLIKKYGTIE